MNQEDKELLFKDLCSRLLYGVKITWNGKYSLTVTPHIYCAIANEYKIDNLPKLLLRPMSSMTEEECDMVEEILGDKCIFDFMGNGDIILKQGQFSQNKLAKLYDYYNLIHVDYRGLIPKGLAIAVTEENNPYKDNKV